MDITFIWPTIIYKRGFDVLNGFPYETNTIFKDPNWLVTDFAKSKIWFVNLLD